MTVFSDEVGYRSYICASSYSLLFPALLRCTIILYVDFFGTVAHVACFVFNFGSSLQASAGHKMRLHEGELFLAFVFGNGAASQFCEVLTHYRYMLHSRPQYYETIIARSRLQHARL